MDDKDRKNTAKSIQRYGCRDYFFDTDEPRRVDKTSRVPKQTIFSFWYHESVRGSTEEVKENAK